MVSKHTGKREQNKLEKRDRIRVAAEKLFTRQGYEATTVRQVADAAEVASGTVFLYARDKEDLLFLVMHERLRRTVDEALASMPRRARLLDGWLHQFKAIYEMYGKHEALARPFVRLVPGSRGLNADLVNALTQTFVQRLALQVQEAQSRGEVRADVDPFLAATMAFGLYFTVLMSWLAGYTEISSLPEALAQALELLFRGLRR
jgi:TetR/AcrR family transcriptional regulator, cholesterol catabolism regulator